METRAQLRLSTLRQINFTRFSLPYELLTCIFNFACPPIVSDKRSRCESADDNEICSVPRGNKSNKYPKPRNKNDISHHYIPLIVSAVCSRWREVALSSPGLWSTFALEVIGWKLKSQVSLLRLYLTNTGSSPFSLDLDIRLQKRVYLNKHKQDAPRVEWRGLQPLADVIFREFPEKIRTLRVAGAPPGWMYFLSQQELSNLKHLTFTWGKDIGYFTTTSIEKGAFTIQPYELRRLGVTASRSRPRPGLPPLTILHLRNVNINICVEILLLCPDLVEYNSYSCRYSMTPSPLPAAVQKPFTLPNLKRFGWVLILSQYRNEWNITLLKNIRLPNLEELQWRGRSRPGLKAVILGFVSNLPELLRSFTYSYNNPYSEDKYYHQFLSHFSSIQSLVFRECSTNFMKKAFRYLSDPTSGMKSTFLVPDLETVTVRSYWEGAQEGVGSALVRMMDKRRQLLGISHFTFEAENCKVRWTHDMQKKCKGFAVRTEGMVHSYFTSKDLALS